VHYVLEAFTLQIVARLEGHQPLGFISRGVTRSGAEVCWTPDSSYVLSGKLLRRFEGDLAHDVLNAFCRRVGRQSLHLGFAS
jgi:hypothetical protein